MEPLNATCQIYHHVYGKEYVASHAFVCSVWISQQIPTVFLYSFNQLPFLMETRCGICVGTNGIVMYVTHLF
jgi:hypothetical protein